MRDLVLLEMFCILTVTMDILAVILDPSFVECHHWGEWARGMQYLSVWFLTTA